MWYAQAYKPLFLSSLKELRITGFKLQPENWLKVHAGTDLLTILMADDGGD